MKSISKNTIFYIIYNSLNVLFPFITGIYVSHVLLENFIGEVEAARNIAQYFVVLSYLGIPTYAVREIAKARNNEEELKKVFSELAVINFISTSVFLAIYLGVIFAVPTYRANYVVYLITGCSIALNFLNITWLYEGLEEFSFICIRNLIFKVLCFVLLLIFVRGSGDYLLYAAITVIGVAGNYLLNIGRARKHVRFTLKNLNLKRHLKPVLFLMAVNVAIEIYTLVDVTMLKFLTSDVNIAYYSYGSKIYKIFIMLLNSFTVVIVPRLSFYKKEGNDKEFNSLLSKTLTAILLLAIPMVIGTYFVSDYLMVAIYGENYIYSSYVLKTLSVIYVISPVGYLLGSRVLLINKKEHLMLIPVVSGAVVNVICNYFLILQYKELGAAIASVISEFVVATIYILLAAKYLKIDARFFKNLVKILAAAGVMALGLVVIDSSQHYGLAKTAKEIIIAVIFYFVTLVFLNEAMVKHYINRLSSRASK